MKLYAKLFLTVLSTLAISASGPFAASAADNADGASTQKSISIRQMTPDQRKGIWNSLSPEQKKRILEKRKAREDQMARWKNLTPDRKEAAKAEDTLATTGSDFGVFPAGKVPEAVREEAQQTSVADDQMQKAIVLQKWKEIDSTNREVLKKQAAAKRNTLTSEEQDQFRTILAYEKAHKTTVGQGDASRPNTLPVVGSRGTGTGHSGAFFGGNQPSIANGYAGHPDAVGVVSSRVRAYDGRSVGSISRNSAGNGDYQ